jgi:hypothetical protein
MVTDGAFGVADAVRVAERSGHGRSVKARAESSTPKIDCANRFCGYVGSMNWQQAVSLAIVASVAGLFLWGRFRRRKFSFERDTHCGCSARGQSETKSSIVFHARKGERPEVVVKMK